MSRLNVADDGVVDVLEVQVSRHDDMIGWTEIFDFELELDDGVTGVRGFRCHDGYRIQGRTPGIIVTHARIRESCYQSGYWSVMPLKGDLNAIIMEFIQWWND